MTPNFDLLIEYALEQSGVPREEIIAVITKKDFEEFSNPDTLFKNNKMAVYKIHGSTENVITEEETRDSLIATIQAFGSGKEGESVFQLEPFKRPLFENITEGRTLVVMGYSGSDDFDIVPTIKALETIKNIIWIKYIADDGGIESIYEIDDSIAKNVEEYDKITQILSEIYRMNHIEHIYLVEATTGRLVENLLEVKPNLTLNSTYYELKPWLRHVLNTSDNVLQYVIPNKIYYEFGMYEECMRCSETMISLAGKERNWIWKAIGLNYIGLINKAKGNLSEALHYYESSLAMQERLDNPAGRASSLNNIGDIYRIQGKLSKALSYFEEALTIYKNLGNLSRIATLQNNIGFIYMRHNNFSKALTQFQEALKNVEKLGNPLEKAQHLVNIGGLYNLKGNYQEALKYLEEALNICQQLKRKSEIALFLNQIGETYRLKGEYPEALKRYEEASEIFEQINSLSGKASSLHCIGLNYYSQKLYSKALKYFKDSLAIFEQSSSKLNRVMLLNDIGTIHRVKGNYSKALSRLEEALEIVKMLDEPIREVAVLKNFGLTYQAQGQYSKALKRFEEVIKIYNNLGLSESPEAKKISERIMDLILRNQ